MNLNHLLFSCAFLVAHSFANAFYIPQHFVDTSRPYNYPSTHVSAPDSLGLHAWSSNVGTAFQPLAARELHAASHIFTHQSSKAQSSSQSSTTKAADLVINPGRDTAPLNRPHEKMQANFLDEDGAFCGMSARYDPVTHDHMFEVAKCTYKNAPILPLFKGNQKVLKSTSPFESFVRGCDNGFIVKIESEHDANLYDRSWTFTCQDMRNYKHDSCFWSHLNAPSRAGFTFLADPGFVITRIASMYDYAELEREFRFKMCRIYQENV